MRGISGGMAAVQALGDAVTGGRGRVTRVVEPLRKGFIAWRSLTQEARGKHTTLVDHSAVEAENNRWKNLAAHWIDGCPCAPCEKARGGR